MRHCSPHLANPVRQPASGEPGNGVEPRIGSAVVTPTDSPPTWLLAALAFAATLVATVGASL